MIGGRIEENETPLETAIKECYKELRSNVVFDEEKLGFQFERIDKA